MLVRGSICNPLTCSLTLPTSTRCLPPSLPPPEFEGEMRADRRDISTRAARYIKFGAVLVAVGLVAAAAALPEPHHH